MHINYLSHNSIAIQWIRSCHKTCMTIQGFDHMFNNTLALITNVIDNVRVNSMFSYLNNVQFEADKIPF